MSIKMQNDILSLVNEAKFSLKALWDLSIVVNFKNAYKLKLGYVILFVLFTLFFGFFLGLSLAKFGVSRALFSENVFAGIFAGLVLVFGFFKIKKMELQYKILEKKFDLISKLSILRGEIDENFQNLVYQMSRLFGRSVLLILHNIILGKRLKQDVSTLFLDLEMAISKDNMFDISRVSILSFRVFGRNILDAIFWILSADDADLKAYSALNSPILIMETDTIPGIFAKLEDTASQKKIFEIKERTEQKPLAVYAASIAQYVNFTPLLKAFLGKFEGLPLTIVVKPRSKLSKFCTKDGFVGFRIVNPKSPFFEFLEKYNLALAGTSANFSGELPPKTLSEVSARILESAQVIKFDNSISTKEPSDVIRFDGQKLTILRPGKESKHIKEWALENEGMEVKTFENGEEKTCYIINKFK